MNEQLLRKLQAHGPWAQHCTDYGDPYSVCHFCNIEADQNKRLEDQTDIHYKDCLWLEINKNE